MLTEPKPDEAAPKSDTPGTEGWSLAWLLGLGTVLVGLGIGIGALSDNSFFTHLVTGQRIVDGDLPRSDPYTFTGGGSPWMVQSWFASLLYGLLDLVGGPAAIRLFTGVLTATLAGLVWRLSRPAPSAVVRCATVATALYIGATMWQERPLLIGLVMMAVVLLAVEGDFRPRLLVPVMWVWVNAHGSYPLALVAVGALLVGAWLDRRPIERELEVLKWTAIGIVVGGVLNPYGPQFLTFPIRMLTRTDILSHVTEWKSPSFDTMWARAFLLLVLAGVMALVRRPSYRHGVPFAIFVAAALLGARNINVAVLIVVPVVAAGLGDLGGLRVDRRSAPTRMACLALIALLPLVAFTRLADDDYDLSSYPVDALEWMEENDLVSTTSRIAHPDIVGNWLELRYAAAVPVFIDDRYELHDRELFADYLTLIRGGEGWDEVLEKWSIDRVVWQRGRALQQIVELDADWEVVYEDDDWFVACPSGTCG